MGARFLPVPCKPRTEPAGGSRPRSIGITAALVPPALVLQLRIVAKWLSHHGLVAYWPGTRNYRG
jgi:hypothetical protein